MLRRGWAKRQMENMEKNIREWPAWMRREAGFEKRDDSHRDEKAQRHNEEREKK
jgi:hypothetical protein